MQEIDEKANQIYRDYVTSQLKADQAIKLLKFEIKYYNPTPYFYIAAERFGKVIEIIEKDEKEKQSSNTVDDILIPLAKKETELRKNFVNNIKEHCYHQLSGKPEKQLEYIEYCFNEKHRETLLHGIIFDLLIKKGKNTSTFPIYPQDATTIERADIMIKFFNTKEKFINDEIEKEGSVFDYCRKNIKYFDILCRENPWTIIIEEAMSFYEDTRSLINNKDLKENAAEQFLNKYALSFYKALPDLYKNHLIEKVGDKIKLTNIRQATFLYALSIDGFNEFKNLSELFIQKTGRSISRGSQAAYRIGSVPLEYKEKLKKFIEK